jgi:hypothetical protein
MKYKVTYTMKVEANSQEEAIEKAYYGNIQFGNYDIEVYEDLEEKK